MDNDKSAWEVENNFGGDTRHADEAGALESLNRMRKEELVRQTNDYKLYLASAGRLFEVKFESPGFVGNRKDAKKIVTDHDGLTESFCGGFNDQTTQDGEFPDGVVGVVTGYITEDDGQGKSDIKVFVSVTLLVEAEDAGAAESFETPVGLLTTLADVMGTIEDECLLSLDGDWEVVDVEKVQTKAAVSINTPARRVRQDLDPEYGRGYDPTPDLDAHTAFFC